MIVFAEQLLRAANEMRERGMKLGKLRDEPVTVTPEQLEKAGRILRDGPQPIANGIESDMPGWIDAEQQEDSVVLVFQVGILPARIFQIGRDGEVLGCPCVGTPEQEECPHA